MPQAIAGRAALTKQTRKRTSWHWSRSASAARDQAVV
jgi:hypothetical protein